MSQSAPFKLTYATMFNPPEAMHERFERALADTRATLGREYGQWINGQERLSAQKFEKRSPINTDWVLGVFQRGTAQDADDALAAARAALPAWRATPWQERIVLARKIADLIDERAYHIAAALALEVGKNRSEALGDVAEAAEFLRYYSAEMERNDGYRVEMGRDPLVGFTARNYSLLKPYGVWVVISPFNFPTALSGGPVAAALITGNTVVLKPATDTPWSVRLLVDCFRDAGLPPGVLNFVTGGGATVGQRLIDNPGVDGITFTGSYPVAMKIYQAFGQGAYPRPAVLEMGGKNAVIVSRHADLDKAATGIVRSAFGLQGQKCSAASRVYVESPLYDALVERVTSLTRALTIGDPTLRSNYLGPVINAGSYREFQDYNEELSQSGHFTTGGRILTDGDFGKGYFCAPTLAVDVPFNHRLWRTELFLPITMIGKVGDLKEAMGLANDVNYGLTSGFYGRDDEAQWYFDHIEAGVNYVNRPMGATTGAWPGYQPFGGWKGSGSSGKNGGGIYYLPLYMREQIQTVIS
ncbi:MAG: aldehyde dehydrogenase family protein [Thermoflexales bacterium]|nr:aldehyde dehydrogenase family protein [Thermoflexales bacterium]